MVEQIGGQSDPADQLQLGQFGLDAGEARPAWIGPQVHQHRRNVTVGLFVGGSLRIGRGRAEQGIEPGSRCGR